MKTTLLAVMILIAPGTAWSQGVAARGQTFFQYAVKFVCVDLAEDRFEILPGVPVEAPLVRGRYLTAINVRNASGDAVTFTKRLGFAGSEPEPVSSLGIQRLGADEAVEIDCLQIRGLPPEVPLKVDKGFLVIRSPGELDVVAVYTARSLVGQVSSIHVQAVPPREVKGPILILPPPGSGEPRP